MLKSARVLLGSVALVALAVDCLVSVSALGAARPDANPDIEKLADAINDPPQFKKLAKDLAGKYDLEDVSWAFKLRQKGGLGVGPKAGLVIQDGIELKLIALEKKQLTAAQLDKEAADLQRMAEVARAVAEAIPEYAEKYTKTPKQAKQWNGYVEDMKKASADMIAAVKANDAKSIKDIANHLNTSCNDCHKKFR
jgi:cytochrome c556